MLQQTRMEVVLGRYDAFLVRFPTIAALASASEDNVTAAWSGLGYYRRARMLRSGAIAVMQRFGGVLPETAEELMAIDGIGRYTAGAISSIAYGRRAPIVDGNIARILSRLSGIDEPLGSPALMRAAWREAERLVEACRSPRDFNQGLMELGALVCTARSPRCGECPIAGRCAWRRAGFPDYDGPTVRPQRFSGTDRQVRGLLLDVLRSTSKPVHRPLLDATWHDPVQRDRALDSLVVDGLIDPLPDGRYALPGSR